MLQKNRIKTARIQSKLTHKEIAKTLGILERDCYFLEGTSIEPDLAHVVGIAKLLDISLDYLFGFTDDPNAHKI